MERFLGELHHLVTFGPRIKAAVHDGRGDEVGPVGESCTEIVDARRTINHRHAATHHLLLRVGRAEVVQLLAPLVYLVAEINLDGADSLATQT